jgi:uncharacterized protein Veg
VDTKKNNKGRKKEQIQLTRITRTVFPLLFIIMHLSIFNYIKLKLKLGGKKN